MTFQRDIELGKFGYLALLAFLIALALGSCAHAPRPVLLWEMCQEKCLAEGASVAATIGRVNPPHRMACICAKDPEGT